MRGSFSYKRSPNKLMKECFFSMKLGEISLLTNDVLRLASFYKALLGVENGNDDAIHQTILAEEPMLTVYNDGTVKTGNNQRMCVAFTVEDMDTAFALVRALGATVLEPPMRRPWGAVNMSFLDPDGNTVYLRQLL